MTWWCAAQDIAWSWSWRPYPGVWLFVASLAAVYLASLRRLAPSYAPLPELTVRPRHYAAFGSGLLVLWVATDWPVGALGAGYLLSVHTAQYLAYTLLVPPLLLVGTPQWLLIALARRGGALAATLKILARPIPALLVVDAVLLITHLPPVVDGFRPTQFGSFTMDLAWLAGGLVMWWPVLAPFPEFGRLRAPGKMGYLFLTTIIPTIPAAFFTFSDFPVYRLYELAPRVHGISAAADQQAAGLMMKALGDPFIWLAIAVVFFRWSRREEAADRVERELRRGDAVSRGSRRGLS